MAKCWDPNRVRDVLKNILVTFVAMASNLPSDGLHLVASLLHKSRFLRISSRQQFPGMEMTDRPD